MHRVMVPIVLFFLIIPATLASDSQLFIPLGGDNETIFGVTGDQQFQDYFMGNAAEGFPIPSPGTTSKDKLSVYIIVYQSNNILTPGEMKYSIVFENNNSYLVKGDMKTWFTGELTGNTYNEHNEEIFVPAKSTLMINITEFIFLVPGKYVIMLEHKRIPSGMKDLAEQPFTVKSATGFIGPGINLTPEESALVTIFIILIIIVAFVILLVVTDYYKYLFSDDPRRDSD